MMSLLLYMLRARWGQALTIFLLSIVATAAAVAGPAALRAVDSAVVHNELAHSSAAERSITVRAGVDPSSPADASTFSSIATLLSVPGAERIRSGELSAYGPVHSGDPALPQTISRLAFRDGLCAHVEIVAGRCVAGSLDVLIGVDTARRAGLTAGSPVDVQAEKVGPNGQTGPDGSIATLTVAGIYSPRDPGELYWASQYYFPVRPDGTRDEALFVTPSTFDLIGHTVGASTIDSLLPASLLTSQRIATLPGELDDLIGAAENSNGGATVSSQVADLAERVRAGQSVAHELVPVAFLPLVALSWFVVFLAVGYGLDGRRRELGMVALRGVRTGRRWWLGTGESLVALVAGAPVGYLVGYGVVWLVSRLWVGGTDGAQLTAAELPYAAFALAGSLLTLLLAQQRALREPVLELLRGGPSGAAAWRTYAVDAVLLLVAAAGVLQLRHGGPLAGVSLLVPGLVVVAVAQLAARAFVPLAGLVARVALRRGSLGAGLAAVQIARRPGSQRLFALVGVATGLLAFIAAGQSVATTARDERASVTVGAPTVLTVDRGTAGRLIAATRAADPAGAWAMAAVTLDNPDRTSAPVLAVDSARLPTVATWRGAFGGDPAALARALAPPATIPFLLDGADFTADIERESVLLDPADNRALTGSVTVTMQFESIADGGRLGAALTVRPGRHSYSGRLDRCAGGCRLTGFTASLGGSGDLIAITLRGLTSGTGTDALPAAQASIQARWRAGDNTGVAAINGGVRAQPSGDAFGNGDLAVSTVDVPVPVPVVVTAGTEAPRRLPAGDDLQLGTRAAATVEMLPRLGSRGVLADLGYLDRAGLTGIQSGQVWLGPAAPPDAIARLRRAGLAVLGSTSQADVRADLDQAGPALALRFHVAAAVLGVSLALGGLWLVAAVDRTRRAQDLRALRDQGLRQRFVRRAALGGYLTLMLSAAAAGLLAAGVAWLGTGDQLPVLTDTVAGLAPPRWPDFAAVVRPWAAATAALLVASVVVAAILCRTVASSRARKG